MDWHAWLTLAVVVATVVAMARELLAPAAAVVVAVVFLLAVGVIEPAEALSGFSNPAPITVAALYVLARAADKTGALQPLLAFAMGSSHRSALPRLLLPVTAVSGFLNNTPIVAMLAPQVADWAEKRGLSPSQFLMPLSFAAILGGMLTAIGTSTNLVISGLLLAHGERPLGLFELTMLGLPVAVAGLVAIVLIAPHTLPARRAARRDLRGDLREFVVDMEVQSGGPLDGRTVEGGGLRHLQSVFLVQVERGGQLIAPVAPEATLYGGDRLRFVGKADVIVDLQRQRGLISAERDHLPAFDPGRTAFFEAVIGASSPLVGRTLRQAGFRNRYQAAVLAIHRSGHRIDAKLGEITLHVGDTLLVLSDGGFRDRWYDRRDFLLVSRLGGSLPTSTRQAGIVGLAGLGVVVLAGTGLVPILQASLLAAAVLVVLGVLTPSEARNAVDLDVVVLIAASFGLGAAIEGTGLAQLFGEWLVAASNALGPVGVLGGVVVATLVLTELITNNAAAVLVFPIAMASAASAGVDPRPLAIGIAAAASASFLTPIGYQTNTMVYGLGGYRFGDYARLGAPLTVIVLTAIVIIVPIFWPL